jgi:site-specific DNA recombinase
MTTRCALYLRVSTAEQAEEDKTSLEVQEQACREFAGRQGWEVAGVYTDAGISGESIDERPAVKSLLVDAAGGKFEVALAHHQDRLGRDSGDFAKIGGTLRAAEVKFATPDRGLVDLTMPADKFTYNIFAAVAEYEKERIKERMAGGRRARKRRGEFGNVSNPYGYTWQVGNRQAKIAGRPVENPAEIAVVKEVFALSAEQRLSCEQIAQGLRERGIPARRGEWFGSQIGLILSHRHYLGEWPTGAKDERGRPVLVKEHPPAVVDPRTWQKAQQTVRHHSRHHGPPSKRDFLLSKLIRCECGAGVTGRAHNGTRAKYRYYKCADFGRKNPTGCKGKFIPAAPLEQAVWGLVERLAADPRLIGKLLAATDRDFRPGWEKDLSRCEKLLAGQAAERTRLLRSLRKGQVTSADFDQQSAEIERERQDLSEKAEALRALIDGDTLRRETGDRVRAEMQALAARHDLMDTPERRDLLRRLAFRVTVNPDGSEARVEIAGEPFLASEGLIPVVAHTAATA